MPLGLQMTTVGALGGPGMMGILALAQL